MKTVLAKRFSLSIALFVILCSLLAPAQGFGQGKGHGRGLDKKAGKFINGHDARDGRWDGRGPRNRIVRVRRYDRVFYGGRAWSNRGHKGKKVRGIYKHRQY